MSKTATNRKGKTFFIEFHFIKKGLLHKLMDEVTPAKYK